MKINARTLWLAIGCACFCAVQGIHAEDKFTIETAQSAATNGDASALYFLAVHYAKGTGVPPDQAKAVDYMTRSAEKGFAFAENDLGSYYAKGRGVKQDFEIAASWYRKAADHGDPLAQFSMGRIYAEGRGVPADPQESLKWYKKSAEQHQSDAEFAVADIYLNGTGVPIDCQAALNWYGKAFADGQAGAANGMGYIYEHGAPPEIPQDLARARQCYQEGADKLDGKAQMNLGRLYLEGSGVAADPVEAYKWFYLANLDGERLANHYLRDMSGQTAINAKTGLLTPEQIAEATKQAQEWRKAKIVARVSAPGAK
ncbi:MAG TPA: tetratricopeptide repeat protein [Verrucomicrobiae bacterium]|jgi:hypothetical protein|nr:tetratricopeptide repeat protein [Verrucomicrobiae bacterium]